MKKFAILLTSLVLLFSFSAMADYGKSFEILENNGDTLKIKVGRLHSSLNEYTLNVSFNGIPVSMANVEVGEVLEYKVRWSGKYTFTFRRLKGWDNFITKFWKIWEQDVFVQANREYSVSKNEISEIANKYAPVTLFTDNEKYYPVSLEYMFNQVEVDEELAEEPFRLKIKKETRHYTRINGARNRDITFPFKDIAKVLPFNGDKIGVVDMPSSHRKNTRMKQRYGSEKHTTVYYSAFEKRSKLYINYHYLYTYDPKNKEDSAGAHVFDRESVTLVFDLEINEPLYMIYGAHLANQKMGIVDEAGTPTQKWKGGRVFVPYEKVVKVGNHPIACAAFGSHGFYPLVGTYQVYLKNKIATLTERAGGRRIILPPNLEMFKSGTSQLKGHNYKLVDLEMGNITSRSWNSILSFSGDFVDILDVPFITDNASFPPYTSRELDIYDYASSRDAYQWNMEKTPASVMKNTLKIVSEIYEITR